LLQSVNIFEWLKLLGGIVTFLGPGFCIVTILYKDSLKSLTHWFILSLAGSVCFWGILLAWLKLFDLRLSSLCIWIIFVSGWIIGLLYVILNRRNFLFKKLSIKWYEVANWVLSIITGLIIVWVLRHQVAGLGSDSYHHTLITQLIHDHGGLPDNYQPATDQLISFSYHYGYHAALAALMWLSGWGARLLVLVSGALLVMITTLSVSLLAEEITEHYSAGIVANAFTGLVFVFPMYMLNWGRYTQLAGLALVPVFLQMCLAYYKKYSNRIDIGKILPIALIATGIAITHYRVTIMAVLAIILFCFLARIDNQYSVRRNFSFVITLAITAGIAFFFFSPWLWQVIHSHQFGYRVILEDISSSYYSITRLDMHAIEYPTNGLVVIYICVGILWGLIKKKWFILWMITWAGTMLLLSGPYLLADMMDRVSVIISLYIPASIIIGWVSHVIYKQLKSPFQILAIIIFLLIISWSGSDALHKNLIGRGFVTSLDLDAAAWIKSNTPNDALFIVNTYKFGFTSNFVIGIDAGYWLPLLADRRTVTIPMIYNIEMFRQPDGLQQLLDLYNLGQDLTTPKAIDYLYKVRASYVYVGEQGGPINVYLLLNSYNFKLVYQKESVYVFKIIY
jgi:hypothetical protein